MFTEDGGRVNCKLIGSGKLPYFTTGSGFLLIHGYFCFAKEKTAVKAVIFHIAHNGFEETEMTKPTKETILG